MGRHNKNYPNGKYTDQGSNAEGWGRTKLIWVDILLIWKNIFWGCDWLPIK